MKERQQFTVNRLQFTDESRESGVCCSFISSWVWAHHCSRGKLPASSISLTTQPASSSCLKKRKRHTEREREREQSGKWKVESGKHCHCLGSVPEIWHKSWASGL